MLVKILEIKGIAYQCPGEMADAGYKIFDNFAYEAMR